MSTHYEVLGVEPDATPPALRAAFLASARRHHPDRVAGRGPAAIAAAEDQMRSVNLAWSVLGDPYRRAAYDRELGLGHGHGSGSSAGPQQPTRTAPTAPPPRSFTPFHDHDEDDDDEWRYEPDPQDPGRTPPRLVVALPPALGALGVALVVLSIPIGIRAVMAAGLVCLALSFLAFIGAPLFAMIQGQEAERRVEQRRRRPG